MKFWWFKRQFAKLMFFVASYKRIFRWILVPVIIVTIPIVIFVAVEPFVERSGHNLSRADFVYDFDYMMHTLILNYPYFGLIYERTGVYLPERSLEIRNRLVSRNEPISFEIFWNMLRDDFFAYAWPVGHLRLVTEHERRRIIEYDRFHGSWWLEFYQHRRVSRPHLIRYDNYMHLLPDERILSLPPLISMSGIPINSIIEEGRIAYLGVRTFAGINDICRRRINAFYEDIADFEHLIIDIRGNPGGDMRYFTELIAGPLVNNSLHAGYRILYMGGRRNHDYVHFARQQSVVFGGIPFTNNISRAFFDEDIPDYIMHDLSLMDYFMIRSMTVSVNRYRVNFEGTIWMLVDEYVYNQAQKAAWFSKETGFAVLVGETTGGMVSGLDVGAIELLPLPNTGIVVRYDPFLVTDEFGRPLENGTDPHFFNLPGMDALETVLQLISEGYHSPRQGDE